MYFGGLRVQEVDKEHLFVEDLDFERNVIHVNDSKFGKSRTVPFIDANFKADLRQLVRGRHPREPVFNVHRRMIQHIVQKAAEEAGITNPYRGARHVSPHVVRHSIARHLKSAGYLGEFIQKFLGHASIKTTMDIYGTLSIGEMQEMVAAKTGDRSLIGDAKSVRPELPYDPQQNGGYQR